MSGAAVVHAEAMAHAVRTDRQFRLPLRPRFIDDLVQVPLADGLLIDGTGEPQVLRGRSVSTVLPRLLDLLDGRRTTDAIEAAVPDLRPGDVQAAIALLYTRGLLEDAAAESADSAATDEALRFFRRHLDATRVNRSAGEAVHRLAQTHVFVLVHDVDDSSCAGLMAAHLRDAGVGAVTALQPDGDLHAQVAAGPVAAARLVIAVAAGEREPVDRWSALDDLCASAGVPWLRGRVSLREERAEIGPYFESRTTPCYDCFVAQARPARCRETTEPRTARPGSHTRAAQRLWADMLVLEAISLMSRIAPPASGTGFMAYDTRAWRAESLKVAKVPGCGRCRPGPGLSAKEPVPPALHYEDAVAFPPRHLVDPKAHQVHYHIANVAMAREAKTYPGLPVRALPPIGALPAPDGTLGVIWEERPPARDSVHLNELAALLLQCGGIRDGSSARKLQRWVATGGNLGSVELYVAAAHVDGLEAGLFYYDSSRHGLTPLPGCRTATEVAARLRAWTGDAAPPPRAAIVAVAALHRVYRKYGPLAYRIVHLDAGVATAQLHLVGAGLNLRTWNVEAWTDAAIAADLRLVGDAECVTAVVGVGLSEVTHAE